MALNIEDFKVDQYRINVPSGNGRGAEKTHEMFDFFASLKPNQSFTLPKKDIGWTRKVFAKWVSGSRLPFALVGRSTADASTYRFWLVQTKDAKK